MKPELRYHQLKYCCIHGGKRFKPGGSGLRDTLVVVSQEWISCIKA